MEPDFVLFSYSLLIMVLSQNINNIHFQMTEYSSDDDDRRTGRSSSDLTPDDFDFDIANYTASASQNAFFSRSVNRKTCK